MNKDSLVLRLITLIKQHRKPSSEKSISVIMKVMEKQILDPKETVDDFKAELQKALKSPALLSELIRQQHSEEEIRNCFTALIAAMEAPEEDELEEDFAELETAE